MPPDASALWSFLPWGYLCTVVVELPVLVAGLALTAFTYPIVICVLPPLVWEPWGRGWYLVVAETFAPLAECLLFRLVWGPAPDRRSAARDAGAIVLANLLSFGLGELVG
jgi:hypothetical protein